MPELLVQYGRSAFVGRFAADGGDLPRGRRVVVRSPRGVEVGTVLGPARYAGGVDPASGGSLLRACDAADDSAAAEQEILARRILTAAEEAPFPVTFLDCEVLHDGRGAILHAVPYEPCHLDPLLADLSDRFALAVRLLNVAALPRVQDPPEPKSSCGSCGTGGGCGSGGCGTGGGCSTGSCSKGQAKTAADMTTFFAGLRTQMEARLPLN